MAEKRKGTEKRLSLDKIRCARDVQPRVAMDKAVIAEYAERLQVGAQAIYCPICGKRICGLDRVVETQVCQHVLSVHDEEAAQAIYIGPKTDALLREAMLVHWLGGDGLDYVARKAMATNDFPVTGGGMVAFIDRDA